MGPEFEVELKVLALPKYGRNGASSRLRMFQYFPLLESAGMGFTVVPLLPQWYLDYIYARESAGFQWLDFFKSFGLRLQKILLGGDYDLIWIQGEIFPWLPAFAEDLLSFRKIPYVVDYDDAIFHRYDEHRSYLVRNLLGRKIETVMRKSALVVAGNDYIARKAELAGASQVAVLPTVVDRDRYRPWETKREQAPFTIGWIGSPSTSGYLELVVPALRALRFTLNFKLLLIGSGPIDIPDIQVEYHPWSEETEVDLLRHCDVGIMPLPDAPWERGKCGFKLIQYMACALPVIASPVGTNCHIVSHEKNGFLASTAKDWEVYLRLLASDTALREKLGEAGRVRVETDYSLQGCAPKLEKLFQAVVGKG